MRLRLVLFTIFTILMPPQIFAHASEDCGIGEKNSQDGSETCVENIWELEKFNDGFSKKISIELSPDTWLSTNVAYFNTLNVQCEKKKLNIFINMDGYIDFEDFSNSDSRSTKEYGYLLFKTDNNKIQKWNWVRKFYRQIELSNPDKLIAQLVKAKKKISFKISRQDAPSILIYPKSDLLKYRKEYRKSGCTF